MNIAEFIKWAVSWFAGTDKKLDALACASAAPLAELTQAKADLATAKTTIGTLEAQVVTLTASNVAEKARADKAEATIANPKGAIAAAANAIAAAQGVPAIKEEKATNSAATASKDDLWAQYEAIPATDHAGRRAFYEANKNKM